MNNMVALDRNKLYMLIGVSASGKSTYAEQLINSNTIVVSSDRIRKSVTGTYQFSSSGNDFIFSIAQNEVAYGLSRGFNVIYDATNLYKKHRKNFIRIAKEYNCDVVAVVFKTPISVCMERNAWRESDRRVPDDIILNMSGADLTINKSEGFSEIIYI